MRLGVTGGRDYAGARCVAALLSKAKAKYGKDLVVVHGACETGLDALADEWCRRNKVRVERHPADWDRLGKSAGPTRNQHMVDSGLDALLSFPGNRGTADMTQRAVNAGIPVGAPVWEIRWWSNAK